MSLREFTEREHLKLATLEYKVEDEGYFIPEPIVQLFCRDADGNRRYVEVKGFRPFFFITEDEYQENEHDLFKETMVRRIIAREGITSLNNVDNNSLRAVDEAPRTTLEGERLVKIETVEPKHVSDMREYFDRTWEADVFFTNRFLIESGIKEGFSIPKGADRVSYDDIEPIEDPPDIKPRVVTMDIEVWSGGVFPDTQDPKKPITAVTVHDSYDDEYRAAVLHPEATNVTDEYTWADIEWKLPDTVDDCPVHVYDNENQMLADVNEWIIDKDPDLLTGWNSSRNEIGSGFDYPYWINRCERINEWTYRDLSPTDTCFVTQRGSPVIGGREMFDMLQAYKKTQIHEKRSYALGYIANEELGYGKEDIADLDLGWAHEPAEFMKYNIRDVEAVVEIENVKSVLRMYDHIRSITGGTYSEIADSNIGIIDLLFLRQAKEKGYALPTSVRPAVQHYWGAYVFPPVPGKHKHVVYPDLSSLYPNLFKDMNASPETIVGFYEDLQASEYTEDDCHTIYVDTRDEQEKRDADEPERTEMFVLKPEVKESFVREVIGDLIDMKYEYKKDEYADEAYEAVKRITNSCFTPDTEVLTPDGIRNIKEIEVDDLVYSWNKETGVMEEKRVTETIEKPDYDGDIIHIENNNMDLKVTPDHRMLVNRSRRSDEWESVRAGELNEWTHYETPNRWTSEHGDGIDEVDLSEFLDESFTITDEYVTAGVNHNDFERFVSGDDFIELIGWFITEGSAYKASDQSRGDTVSFAQYKSINSESYQRIVDTVENLGCYASKTERAVELCGTVYHKILSTLCGNGSENKKIPEFIFEKASKNQKELLLEVMMLGDGDKRESPKRYSTKSDELRDGFIRLLWELGHKPRYRYDDSGENNSGVWRINYTIDSSGKGTRQSFRMHRDGTRESAENGVYCIQVEDNHTLVAGRNGKFTNIFNCYGVMGDSVSYGVGFRLFDWRIAEAITLAGRDVIKHTADEFIDYVRLNGYEDAEIIAGDTDSCVAEINGASSMEETLSIAIEAAEHVDDTFDNFMYERFGIEDANMAVEIESYAEAALFMDKKKRYAQWIRWDEGEEVDEIEVKGFELVRSDSSEITARVQKEVLTKILKEDDAKEHVREYLREEWQSVIDGEVELDDIGKPSAMSNPLGDYGWTTRVVDTDEYVTSIDGEQLESGDEYVKYYTAQPHVRGARYANEYIEGEDMSEGSKPLFFYADGVRLSSDLPETYEYETEELNDPDLPAVNERGFHEEGREVDAISVEDARNMPDGILIDWDKMAEKTLRDPIEPIAEVMGWAFDDLITEGKQSGLADFM